MRVYTYSCFIWKFLLCFPSLCMADHSHFFYFSGTTIDCDGCLSQVNVSSHTNAEN